jgi:16S rRNA (cytidine1402-2'-O)-methyltransferase
VSEGRLLIVGTPIGNLEDMSPRAVRALREADVVAAEDTRAIERLCAHFGIQRPKIVSCFEGNEAQRSEELVARMLEGACVVYASEAGMPGVSDPGERLVAAAAAAGIKVEVVPGPSAALAALVASGLPSARFTFVGFPPRDEGPRRELYGSLAGESATLIFFESPGRTGASLADLRDAFGESRRAAVCRELTKVYEETVRGTLAELAARYADEGPRGEVTLVVAGASKDELEARGGLDVEAEIVKQLAAGGTAKEIAARLALQTGKPKRQLYQLALALSGKR